jgi:mono/diheme cytochrome c family protein
MRIMALGGLVVGMGLIVVSGPAEILPSPASPSAALAAAPARAMAPATLTAVVQQYCVTCHNDQLLTGNVSFQGFDVDRAGEKPEIAERMIRKLRVGMMPPPGMPRPAGDTLQTLVETLEANVDRAVKAAPPNLGERRFQRLSRKEYERVIKDLLALDIDAGKWLPADFYNAGFDNQSAAQQFSATLLDSFLRAAGEVARLAVGNPDAAPTTVKHINNDRLSQHAWSRLEGAPYGTRGGQVVLHDFPADGEYVFQVKTNQGTGSGPPIEDLDISIDGEPVALIKLEFHGGQQLSSATQQGSGFDAAIDGAITTEPIFVRAGQHRVSAAFVNRIDGMYEDRFSPVDWSSVGNASFEYGTTGLTHITELWVTGPQRVTGVSETPSREKVFICRPKSAAEERACAGQIFKHLATQAYRRPTTEEDVVDLLRFYDAAAAKDGFEIGVRMGLQAILLSPDFWFRLEREVEGTQVAKPTDVELATRLSFFLWDTAPDEELLALATSGRLANPSVLEQQVKRMLADPRSESLSTRFAHQWLMLQDVGRVWPQGYQYPDFTRQVADDLVRETEMLFDHLVREDKSMLELFGANYTFLNERLARHYGIPGISGDEMRMVPYPADSNRRGVLSHGSLLQLTSVSERTSPVLRGKYVMTVIMGTPPPAPPPNVPPFEASPTGAGGRRLTTRERMEMHRTSQVCNSCHRFMDPIGLALDNFDVTGRWRVRENMAALDTRGVFYDGTPISKPNELVDVLLKRPVPLVRQFTTNLMAYALGRGVEYYDQPTIRAITRAAEKDGYRLSSLIMGVVKSDAFLKKQAQSTN